MDRRQYHRVDAEDPALEVVLGTVDGACRAEAELLNLALGGALVRVPPLGELVVPMGGNLHVMLRDRTTQREARLLARLVHRHEQGKARILGVQFLDLREAESLLTPALARAFNRRGAFRVMPSAHEATIEVTLEAPREANLPLQQVVLMDLSTGGLGVDVPVAFEAGMAQHDLIECMFLLPGDRMPLAVRGEIRHRTLGRHGVRYGVMFVDLDKPAYARAYESILSYVLRRQRELGQDIEAGRMHILELLRAGGDGR